jgi:hypothetical protein
MKKTILIGDFPLQQGLITITINEYPFISQNSEWYWCSNHFTGYNIKIKKDTIEGIKLAEMIDNNYREESILEFITTKILSRLDIIEIYNLISEVKDKSYTEGLQDKEKQIKQALGIKD